MNIDQQQVSGRVFVGKVISAKTNKTIIVEVERKVMHPLYGKYMRKFSKLTAHDPENICKLGDTVEIQMCRPISKKKSWKLIQIIKSKINKEVID